MKLTSRPAKQWAELLLSPRLAAYPSAGRFVFFSHFLRRHLNNYFSRATGVTTISLRLSSSLVHGNLLTRGVDTVRLSRGISLC